MSKQEISIIMDLLKEMHADIKKLSEEKIPKLDKRIAVVETKATIYGSVGGAISAALIGMITAFKR